MARKEGPLRGLWALARSGLPPVDRSQRAETQPLALQRSLLMDQISGVQVEW
jgi:hypothetical protein